MTQIKWKDKHWQTNTKVVNSADNLTISQSFNTDEGKKDKMSIELPYSCYIELGVNPKSEIDYFFAVLGKSDYIYVGKQKLVGCKMKLTNVSLSDVQVTENGVVRSAMITLSFEEE